jgi:hypothetical protein
VPVRRTFPIKVGGHGGETAAEIEFGLTRRGLPRAVLRSSATLAPNMRHDHWPAGLGWSIDERLRSDGALKGRVLAIWQDAAAAKTPVAALCWHLHASGPLYVLDAGCADAVLDDEPLYMALLLLCLRQIAGHRLIARDQDRLRWSLVAFDRAPRADQAAFRRAGQQRAERLGFRVFAGKRPAWTKGWWLGEHSF